jgi:hypothetical protein
MDTWMFALANSTLVMEDPILKTLTVFVIISKLWGWGSKFIKYTKVKYKLEVVNLFFIRKYSV